MKSKQRILSCSGGGRVAQVGGGCSGGGGVVQVGEVHVGGCSGGGGGGVKVRGGLVGEGSKGANVMGIEGEQRDKRWGGRRA